MFQALKWVLPDRRTLQKHQHKSWHQWFCCNPSTACTERGWAEAGQSAGGSGGLLRTEKEGRWGQPHKQIFYTVLREVWWIFSSAFIFCLWNCSYLCEFMSVCKFTLRVRLRNHSLTHRFGQSCPTQWWHIWFQRGCWCWRRPGTPETHGTSSALGTTASEGWCHCWSSGHCSMGEWWPGWKGEHKS